MPPRKRPQLNNAERDKKELRAFLETLKNKADHRMEAGQHEEAIRVWKQFVSKTGMEHGETLQYASACGLAGDSCVMGAQLTDALQFYERSLKTTQKLASHDTSATTSERESLVSVHSLSLGNLAFYHYTKGTASQQSNLKIHHYTLSSRFFTRQISWLESNHSPSHKVLIDPLTNHASLLTRHGAVLQKRDPWIHALEQFNRALSIVEATEGKNGSYRAVAKKIVECEAKMKTFSSVHAAIIIQRFARRSLTRKRFVKASSYVSIPQLSCVAALAALSAINEIFVMGWSWAPHDGLTMGHYLTSSSPPTLFLSLHLPNISTLADCSIHLADDGISAATLDNKPIFGLFTFPARILPHLAVAKFMTAPRVLFVEAPCSSMECRRPAAMRRGSELPPDSVARYSVLMLQYEATDERFSQLIPEGNYRWDKHANPEANSLFGQEVPAKYTLQVFVPEIRFSDGFHVECERTMITIIKVDDTGTRSVIHVERMPYSINPMSATGSLTIDGCLLMMKVYVSLPEHVVEASVETTTFCRRGKEGLVQAQATGPLYCIEFDKNEIQKLFEEKAVRAAAEASELESMAAQIEQEAKDRVVEAAKQAEQRQQEEARKQLEKKQSEQSPEAILHTRNEKAALVQSFCRGIMSRMMVRALVITHTCFAAAAALAACPAVFLDFAGARLSRVGRGLNSRRQLYQKYKTKKSIESMRAEAELAVRLEEEDNAKRWLSGRQPRTEEEENAQKQMMEKVVENRNIAEQKTQQLVRVGSAALASRAVKETAMLEEANMLATRLHSVTTLQSAGRRYAAATRINRLKASHVIHEHRLLVAATSGLVAIVRCSLELDTVHLFTRLSRGTHARQIVSQLKQEEITRQCRQKEYEKRHEEQQRELLEHAAAYEARGEANQRKVKAAVKIQTLFRCVKARQEKKRREGLRRKQGDVARIVQIFCRSRLAMIVVSRVVIDFDKYAERIQRAVRCKQARNAALRKTEERNAAEAAEKHRAQEAIEELALERIEGKQITESVLLIQRQERGRVGRRIARDRRRSIQQEQDHAACSIQKIARGVATRKRVTLVKPVVAGEKQARPAIRKEESTGIETLSAWIAWQLETTTTYTNMKKDLSQQCDVVTNRIVTMETTSRRETLAKIKNICDIHNLYRLTVTGTTSRSTVANSEQSARRLVYEIFDEISRIDIQRKERNAFGEIHAFRVEDGEQTNRMILQRCARTKAKMQTHELHSRAAVEAEQNTQREELQSEVKQFIFKWMVTHRQLLALQEAEAMASVLLANQAFKERVAIRHHSKSIVQVMFASERHLMSLKEAEKRHQITELEEERWTELTGDIYNTWDEVVHTQTRSRMFTCENHHTAGKIGLFKEESTAWHQIFEMVSQQADVHEVYLTSVTNLENTERSMRWSMSRLEITEFTETCGKIRNEQTRVDSKPPQIDNALNMVDDKERAARTDVDGSQAALFLNIFTQFRDETDVLRGKVNRLANSVFSRKSETLFKQEDLRRVSIENTRVTTLVKLLAQFEDTLRTAIEGKEFCLSSFAKKRHLALAKTVVDVNLVMKKLKNDCTESYRNTTIDELEKFRAVSRRRIAELREMHLAELLRNESVLSQVTPWELSQRHGIETEQNHGCTEIEGFRVSGMNPIQKAEMVERVRRVVANELPRVSTTVQKLTEKVNVLPMRREPDGGLVVKVEENCVRQRIEYLEESERAFISGSDKSQGIKEGQFLIESELVALESVTRSDLETSHQVRRLMIFKQFEATHHMKQQNYALETEAFHRDNVAKQERAEWDTMKTEETCSRTVVFDRKHRLLEETNELINEERRSRQVLIFEEDAIGEEVGKKAGKFMRVLRACVKESMENREEERAVQRLRRLDHITKVEASENQMGKTYPPVKKHGNRIVLNSSVSSLVGSPCSDIPPFFNAGILPKIKNPPCPPKRESSSVVASWWATTVFDRFQNPCRDGLPDPETRPPTSTRKKMVKLFLAPEWEPYSPAGFLITHAELTQILALYRESCAECNVSVHIKNWTGLKAVNRDGFCSAVAQITHGLGGNILLDVFARLRTVMKALKTVVMGPSPALRALWNVVLVLQDSTGHVAGQALRSAVETYLHTSDIPVFVSRHWNRGALRVGDPLLSRFHDVVGCGVEADEMTFIAVAEFVTTVFLPLLSPELIHQALADVGPAARCSAERSVAVLVMSHVPKPEPFFPVFEGIRKIYEETNYTGSYYKSRVSHVDNLAVKKLVAEGTHVLDGARSLSLQLPDTASCEHISSSICILLGLARTGGSFTATLRGRLDADLITSIRQLTLSSTTFQQALSASAQLRLVGNSYMFYPVCPLLTSLTDWARAIVKSAALSYGWDKKLMDVNPKVGS